MKCRSGLKNCACEICMPELNEYIGSGQLDKDVKAKLATYNPYTDCSPGPSVDLSYFQEHEATAKPDRYQGSNGMEVWDAINGLGLDFLQGSVVKYVSRYKKKNGSEDLTKAINFLTKLLANYTNTNYYELRKLTIDELTEKFKKDK